MPIQPRPVRRDVAPPPVQPTPAAAPSVPRVPKQGFRLALVALLALFAIVLAVKFRDGNGEQIRSPASDVEDSPFLRDIRRGQELLSEGRKNDVMPCRHKYGGVYPLAMDGGVTVHMCQKGHTFRSEQGAYVPYTIRSPVVGGRRY